MLPSSPGPFSRGQEKGELVDTATQLLVAAANPERVILFGSYARGAYGRQRPDLL